MSNIKKDSWESLNESRRYPFMSFAGDTYPQFIVDLRVFLSPGYNPEDMYINHVKIFDSKVTISLRDSSSGDIVLYGGGKSGGAYTLKSDGMSHGYVTVGMVNEAGNKDFILTPAEGRLAPGVVNSMGAAQSNITVKNTQFSGIVGIAGRGGVSVSVKQVSISGDTHQVVYVDFSSRVNRRVLPDCAVPAEELWARKGRQGILTINGQAGNSSGNLDLTVAGTGSINGEVLTIDTIPVSREDVCRKDWDLRVAVNRDVCLEPSCD
jgi:hypothetical protein